MTNRCYALRIRDFKPGIRPLREYVKRCRGEIIQEKYIIEKTRIAAYGSLGSSLIMIYNVALTFSIAYTILKGLEHLASK